MEGGASKTKLQQGDKQDHSIQKCVRLFMFIEPDRGKAVPSLLSGSGRR